MPKSLHDEINRNHKIFADEYIIDRKGARAYKVAYPHVIKTSVASAAANRLLKRVNIRSYVESQLRKIARKSEITVARILEEEARLAYSDVSDLWDKSGLSLIPPRQLPEGVRRAIASVEVVQTFDQDGAQVNKYKYRMWNKGAALERLEKHLGMFQADKMNDEDVSRVADRILESRRRHAETDS